MAEQMQRKLSDQFREWVASELQRTGKTRKELAATLNLAPSAATRLLNGERDISTEEAIRLSHFFGSPDKLLHLMLEHFPGYRLALREKPTDMDVEEHVDQVRTLYAKIGRTASANHLYVLETEVGNDACDLLLPDRVAGRIPIPDGLKGKVGMVAMIVATDIMAPMVRAKDPIFLIPLDDWQEDQPLLVCEGSNALEDGRRPLFIGLLTDANADLGTLTLEHMSDGSVRVVDLSQTSGTWRVATQAELFPI